MAVKEVSRCSQSTATEAEVPYGDNIVATGASPIETALWCR